MPLTAPAIKPPKSISELFSGAYSVTVVRTPSYIDGEAHWDTRSCQPVEATALGLLVVNPDGTLEFFPWNTVSSVKWTA